MVTSTRTRPENRPLDAGEPIRSYIARELPESDVEFYAGRLLLSDTLLAKSGKNYRVVTLDFKDKKGAHCRLKRLYHEGQCKYADVFLPYHRKEIVVGASGVNTKEVEEEPRKGGGVTYIYMTDVLFVFSLHAFHPGRDQDQRSTPPPEPEPEPAEDASTWDAPLPDEVLPDEGQENAPQPAVSIPTPLALLKADQLAQERQKYWSIVEETLFSPAERETFLDFYGLSRLFLDWTPADLDTIDAYLEEWYNALSPEHLIGHDNWDQPITAEQYDTILAIMNRFANPDDGKAVIREHLKPRGLKKVKELTRASLEVFRRELLADPLCPPDPSA